MLKTQRVQDLAGMQAAIDKGQWDVVISEFSLPHFSAQMAHDLLKRPGANRRSLFSPAPSPIMTWSRPCAATRRTWS